jgi:hypothetical protein
MCKPAVYVYDKFNRKNNLKIQYNNSSYFTKLIPHFNAENSWDFYSNNGKVIVDNETYDYLYYAIKVTNFKHNLN